MKATRNIDAKGLVPTWTPGEHEQATVTLHAEQFCLGCHVKAQVGDVLGTVHVRSYLERKEALWWQEVRLTAGALSLKILVSGSGAALLHAQLMQMRGSFETLTVAVQAAAPPAVLAEVQSAEHKAFARSLRDMALLEATMQQVAESGQRVLQRLQQGRKGVDAAI